MTPSTATSRRRRLVGSSPHEGTLWDGGSRLGPTTDTRHWIAIRGGPCSGRSSLGDSTIPPSPPPHEPQQASHPHYRCGFGLGQVCVYRSIMRGGSRFVSANSSSSLASATPALASVPPSNARHPSSASSTPPSCSGSPRAFTARPSQPHRCAPGTGTRRASASPTSSAPLSARSRPSTFWIHVGVSPTYADVSSLHAGPTNPGSAGPHKGETRV